MATHEKYEANKILVLDDEKLIRLAVCARLKRAGYESVAVGTVDEAVKILKQHHRSFCAIISDIMMGEMDGFVFRDIVRGIDSAMPFFFMTALDPEEGSGFLKRIIGDPMCYYLPKSAGTEVLVKRLQRVVAARCIQQFVENQVAEQRKSLTLAAHVQRSMLPARAMMDERCFYTTWWRPHESVSGDLYEVMPISNDRLLLVVGDIQGHGTNAALVMMAVQAFLRQTAHAHARGNRQLLLDYLANQLQGFFRANFADISYMTALIGIYTLPPAGSGEKAADSGGSIAYIACGTPEPVAFDLEAGRFFEFNAERRGGLPIGLMPDTVYTPDDVVRVQLPPNVVCAAFTDGLYELSLDDESRERITPQQLRSLSGDLVFDASKTGSVMVVTDKFMTACTELGFVQNTDDLSILVFGPRLHLKGIYEATTPLSPTLVDAVAQDVGGWCAREGWPVDLGGRVQLVLEEHLMNVYDHGFDEQQRRKDVVSLRLRRQRDLAELTVWDYGRPPPSMKVAAGVTDTAFDLINNAMSNHGRGRLMVRQLCEGIQRQRYGNLNETTFYIPWNVATKEENT